MNDFYIGDNATAASSRGLYVESFEDISLPATRQEQLEIPNRNGFLTVGDSSLRGVKRIAHCWLARSTNNTTSYVFNWLRNGKKVQFSDESGLFRYYTITGEMRARSLGSPLGYEFDVEFNCQPFRYWVSPTTQNVSYAEGTSESGKQLNNGGLAPNAPLIRVGRASASGGASWIAWGAYASERIEFSNLQYPLYIDSELQEVYFEDSSLGNANAVTSLQKFPSIPAGGSRVIKFGGNVSTLQVQMRERTY